MYVLHVLVVIFLAANTCRSSEEVELMIDELECMETCQLEKNRLCHKPPLTCGDCLSAFTADSDGVCRPRKSAPSESHHEQPPRVAPHPDRPLEADQKLVGAENHDRGFVSVQKKDPATGNSGTGAQAADTNNPQPTGSNQQPVAPKDSLNETLLIVLVVSCSVVLVLAIIIAIVCSCRLHKMAKATSDVDYPAYGSTGPYQGATTPRLSPNERKLAQSAQMFHYQHQKQQMLEIEKSTNGGLNAASDASSEEDGDDEQFTVYECPGLATTGEMEVQNPLFMETPVDGVGAPVVPDAPGAPVPNGHHIDKK